MLEYGMVISLLRPEDNPRLKHGRRSTYTYYGCHCDPCKAANAKYKRDKTASNRTRTASSAASLISAFGTEARIPWLTHGLPNTYDWYGCRCPECTEAYTKSRQERRLGLVS